MFVISSKLKVICVTVLVNGEPTIETEFEIKIVVKTKWISTDLPQKKVISLPDYTSSIGEELLLFLEVWGMEKDKRGSGGGVDRFLGLTEYDLRNKADAHEKSATDDYKVFPGNYNSAFSLPASGISNRAD
jgi:hypothetical protein